MKEDTQTLLVTHKENPQHTFKGGAFAIIFNNNKEVLLCHRTDKDLWNLPGGRQEKGEAPWDTAIRETKEEVGLIVKVEKLVGQYFKPEANENCFAYLCSVIAGEPTLSNEADDIQYFSVDALPENISQKQVERIKDALAEYSEPVLRIQQ